jgi:hypothetical protein
VGVPASLLIASGAWASGIVCVVVTVRHARSLQRNTCPGVAELVERVRAASADAPLESRDAFARLELDLVRDEATRRLALATLVPRGMARIALATGAAVAALALARYGTEGIAPATLGAFLAIFGGALCSSVAAGFGRRAREAAEAARREWKRVLKLAENELASRT